MRRIAVSIAAMLSLGMSMVSCGGSRADPGLAADEDVAARLDFETADPGTEVPTVDAIGDTLDAPQEVAADVPGDTGTGATIIRVFNQARITSLQDQPNFQNVRTSLHLDGPATAVRLVLDLDTTCFPFTKWATNPPPPGQDYPADCDAYDRNFEVTIDDPAKDGDPPAIELVRAITPFGGPMHVEADVTDVLNGLAPGDHAVRIHISTWSAANGKGTGSAGGWTVSARLEVTPGPAPRKVLAVVPLWNGSLGAGEPPAPVSFNVPEGTTAGRIEIRATGHGGTQVDDPACLGGAEEFCKRTHTWNVDDTPIGEREFWVNCLPWCQPATWTEGGGKPFVYCALNPCGNTMSVVALRANWCPGAVTDAVLLDAPVLSATGQHTFAFEVPGIAAGGSWRISAVYVAIGQ